MSRRRLVNLVLLFGALSLLSACASLKPEKLRPEPQKVNLTADTPVHVEALQSDAAEIQLYLNGQAQDLDLNGFSNELSNTVADFLQASGIDVGQGDRRIGLRVVWLDFLFQGPCILDYNVVLGESEPFGLQSRGASSHPETGCRTAYEAAAKQILSDERTVQYLGGQ